MHLIAHRGWAEGKEENTLAAFARAAGEERISGVEFDVCRAADSGAVVVSHDPPPHAESALTLDAALSFLSRTDLELFVEIKEEGLALAVIEKLVLHNLADRSVVFAFAAVARSFAWKGARPVRLGVIVTYPWNLHRTVRALAPDVLLLGWDARRSDTDDQKLMRRSVLGALANLTEEPWMTTEADKRAGKSAVVSVSTSGETK